MRIMYRVDGFCYDDLYEALEYIDDQLSTTSWGIQFGYYAIQEGIEIILKMRIPINITICDIEIEVVLF